MTDDSSHDTEQAITGKPSTKRASATPGKPRKRATSISGKRSEVKDAHDRYANIEVSYD